jgi:hypothetical protein
MNRREHRDRALLELLADLDIAVGGGADHPLRTPLFRLLVNERSRLVTVVLVAG